MKAMKYLVVVLTLTIMLGVLTACGSTADSTSVEDDFKEYLNNHYSTFFEPENNDIVKVYTDAVLAKDGEILAKALSETLPPKNDALLEELKAYSPETTEVQELHAILIDAVELRKEAYAEILVVLMNMNAAKADINAAFDKLDEANAMLAEFSAKAATMKKDLGLVDAK